MMAVAVVLAAVSAVAGLYLADRSSANIALRVPYKRLLWDAATMEFTERAHSTVAVVPEGPRSS